MFVIHNYETFVLFKKNWIAILVSALLGAAILTVYSMQQGEDAYFLRSSIMIEPIDNEEEVISLKENVASVAYLMNTDGFQNEVFNHLGIMKASFVKSLTIAHVDDSLVIEIKVTGPSANIITNVSKGIIELAILRTKDMGFITTIVDPGVVVLNSAKTENTTRMTLLGLLAGAGIACCFILLRYYLNDCLRNEKEVNEFLSLPVVAALPSLKQFDKRTRLKDMPAGYSKWMARVSIYAVAKTKGCVIVGIASTDTGDGRTTVALKLAEILAYSGNNPLFISFDAAQLSELAKLDTVRAVHCEDLINGDVCLSNAVAKSDSFDVLLIADRCCCHHNHRGVKVPEELLSQLRLRYDVVLIDLPPISQHPEAALVAALADKVFFIVVPYVTNTGVAQSTLHLLREAGSNVTGCILNKNLYRPMVK